MPKVHFTQADAARMAKACPPGWRVRVEAATGDLIIEPFSITINRRNPENDNSVADEGERRMKEAFGR